MTSTSGQVARMVQRLAARQAASTCTIERATTVRDAGGSPVLTWATHLLLVTVHIQIKSGAEAVRYGRENVRRFATAYLEPGQDIAETDRVVWNNRTFNITSVRTPGGRDESDELAYTILELEETL